MLYQVISHSELTLLHPKQIFLKSQLGDWKDGRGRQLAIGPIGGKSIKTPQPVARVILYSFFFTMRQKILTIIK